MEDIIGKEKNSNFLEMIKAQRCEKPVLNWTGTVLDYLNLVKCDPAIATFAPGRVYNMIMKHGTTAVDDSEKTMGYEDLVSYNFFTQNGIYGSLESLHDLMRFLKAASKRTETGKRILIMVGPVSSGKSTIASMIKRGLERDTAPIYTIEGCPLHEEPLHVIPIEDREFWNKELGLHIEGDICPVCRHNITKEWKLVDEHGRIRWEDVPVVQKKLSAATRTGVGTFQPSDPRSQDSTELIGRVNMAKMARYGETDPRAFEFNGELEVANRGMIEYIEILKADIRLHHVLLTVAQEQLIKAPGFPQIYLDTLILSHTNETEFDIFKSDSKNEALQDRMYPVFVPWNLKVADEVEIYKKMIRESDMSGIHISPHALETAARFAVLTRLCDSTKISNKVQKMRLYNGETLEGLATEEINVKALREEGKKRGEGRKGISPRFVINALNVALGTKEERCCINPVDVIRGLRNNFEHAIGMSEEEKREYNAILLGEKDSVTTHYKEIAKKEVNRAFLSAFDDQAQALFENYMTNIGAYCRKEKIQDPITGEYSSPSEPLMRSIEELINVPVNSRDTFRQGIFVHKSGALERGEAFNYKSYAALAEGIEKKLMADLKNTVALTLVDPTKIQDEKTKRRRNDVLENLKKLGYCEQCAQMLLQFVADVLRREA